LGKRSIQQKQKGVRMDSLIVLLVSVMFASFGQLFMKKGMDIVGQTSVGELISGKLVSMFTQPYVVAGIGFYALSTVLYLVALSNLQLSVAYPLIGLAYIIVAIMSSLLLGEAVTLSRWAGILFIVVGAILITAS
jgi:drug/metabolite transporter (DMT)-like permease